MKKILLYALLCSLLPTVCFADDMSAASAVKQDKLQSANLSALREFGKDALMRKTPLTTDKLVYNLYFLAPRQILNLHKHQTSDELFYIAEGNGQFTVGNDQVMVEPGSAVYGPANVPHGVINSGQADMVVVSVQAPTPVQTEAIPDMTITCSVCGQVDILPTNAKVGDIYVCPRCHQKLKLGKTKDGKWTATPI